jgi:hypothetical protein
MGALLDLLILFEHAYTFTQYHWRLAKEWMRQQLGPSENITYFIMDDNSVIPANVVHCKSAPKAIFSPVENHIRSATQEGAMAPLKRLPWLSVQHTIGDHTVDLSDWLSEIRTNATIPLIALVRLASATMHKHLPETANAKITTIDRSSGEEEEWHYVGNVDLRRPPMHHRETLPFDNSGVPIY